jgi:hypothetical protein
MRGKTLTAPLLASASQITHFFDLFTSKKKEIEQQEAQYRSLKDAANAQLKQAHDKSRELAAALEAEGRPPWGCMLDEVMLVRAQGPDLMARMGLAAACVHFCCMGHSTPWYRSARFCFGVIL